MARKPRSAPRNAEENGISATIDNYREAYMAALAVVRWWPWCYL